MGRSHVLDLLRPSYKTPTPPEVLQKLENHFHSLIRFETGSFVEIGKLYLPVLEYLTELDGTAVWFPIQLDYTSAVSFNKNADGDVTQWLTCMVILGL